MSTDFEKDRAFGQTVGQVSKSQWGANPVADYCTKLTVKQDPLQEAIHKKTLAEGKLSIMLGAPEVLQIGQNFLRLIGGKKVLDVGTYTGASAVAWALAIPEGGHVLSMDITHEALTLTRPLIDERKEVAEKIEFRLGSALETLDGLLSKGETGKWDFAFIDADKPNYPNYYERLVQLLRPGGVIIIDNALWSGAVVAPETESAKAIDAVNRLASEDDRTDNFLVNVGDGLHVIFKK